MPLFPDLVGGLTIRERPQRFPGESKYRRLDFIRPKSSDDSDSWPIIRSTQPIRALQVYEYHPYCGYYQQNPAYYQSAYRQPIAGGSPQARLAQYPAGHYIHSVPAPPLNGGHAQKAIEDSPNYSPWGRALDTDDDIVGIIDEKDGKGKKSHKGKKSRSPSPVRPAGHSIFDSDSSSSSGSESESYHKKRARRKRKSH